MAGWTDKVHGDPIPWLLEPDKDQPAIRYFTLRDILGLGDNDNQVREARASIMSTGPVPEILAAQQSGGYWLKPGPGYSPKYRSTVWQVIFLAQLGADGSAPAVRAGCEYVLSHSVARHGGFSVNGTPSGFVHCLAGNLGAALIGLGMFGNEQLQAAIECVVNQRNGTLFEPNTLA